LNPLLANYLSRHFWLSLFVLITSYALCTVGRLSGGEYAGICGGVLASFRVGDLVDTWLHQSSAPVPVVPAVPGRVDHT